MSISNVQVSRSALFFLAALFAVSLAVALPAPAHAQFDGDFSGGYGDGGGCCGFSDYYDTATPDYSYYDTATPDYSYYDTATPDYGYYDTASYPSYDYGSSYPYSSYGSGYASYMPSSFFMPSMGYSYSQPSYSQPSNSNVFAPTNTTIANNGNSCTAGNSCNTTISTPTTISYNNATPSYPVYPTYPTYQNPTPTCYISISPNYASPGQIVTLTWSATNATYGTITNIGAVPISGSRTIYPTAGMTYTGSFSGSGGSTNCYATVNMAPIAYNTTPYVTLSQVPYTGLDLGPVGTAFYWLFLVLWCAIGAYFITVKKVQNKLGASLRKFLLGDEKAPRHPVYQMQTAATPMSVSVPTGSRDDSFILSQINRNK